VVRYVVVNAGSGLSARRVLLSPMSMARSWDTVELAVRLTREQIERSPDADAHRPVSRQFETELLQHYGHPFYWGGAGLWGAYGFPAALLEGATSPPPLGVPPPTPPARDQHLRSVSEVIGYHLHASDGEIGHVDDFLVDEQSWQIRYLQVDTSNFIGGRAVAVSPQVLTGIDWPSRVVNVDITRAAVKDSPRLDAVEVPSAELAPKFALI
jgi:hypothetical protein